MKRLSAIFALTAASSFCLTLACGEDDDAPASTGGRSGSPNTESGGKRTSGGTSNAGSTSEPAAGAGNPSTSEGGAGGGGETSTAPGAGAAGDGGAAGAPSIATAVEGRIVDASGSARGGVSVVVDGRSKLTDSDGLFRFEDVGERYDVLAFPTDGHTTFVYQGLTLRNPVLVVNTGGGEHAAQLSGKIDYPPSSAASFFGAVGVASHAHAGPLAVVDLKERTYGPLNVTWSGATHVNRDLLALVWIRDDAGMPLEYLGFGSSPLSLQADDELSDADVHIEELDMGTRSLVVSGSVPEGYSVLRHTVQFGSIPLLDRQTDSPSGSYKVPAGLTPGHLVLRVESGLLETPEGPASQRSVGMWLVGDEANKVNFELHAAPAPVVPLEGATGVNKSTLFQWQPFTEGVHRLDVNWGDNHVVVYTQADSTKLPDLAVVGLAYPSDGEYTWTVSGLGPVLSLDQWVSTEDQLGAFGAVYNAESPVRSFTFKE